MKKLIILYGLLLLGAYSCNSILDEDKEKEAIKAVIEEDKDAYFARDAARQGEIWMQDDNSRKIYYSPDGMTLIPGWSGVDAEQKENAESEMWDNVKDLEGQFSDYEFNFYNNTAMVFCKTTWTGLYYGEELAIEQHRILHFVKANGKWKYDLMAMYRIPDGNATENKKTAALYHDLNPDDMDAILTEDFIGQNEKRRFTWTLENHKNYWTNNRGTASDTIFQQVSEGEWVATWFARTADWSGDIVTYEMMHFKRFEDGKIAEIWEYGDPGQLETDE